jgi:hypothetical protein
MAGSLEPDAAQNIKAENAEKPADQDRIQVPTEPKGSG